MVFESKDELHLEIPQSFQAKAEAIELMNVKNCITSSATSKPISALTQDGVVGAYHMTADDVIIPETTFNDFVVLVDLADKLRSLRARIATTNINPFSGKALFSLVLPEDMQLQTYDDKFVFEIKNGICVRGRATKEILSSGSNSIIQYIYRTYGPDIASTFISNLAKISTHYLTYRGFTVSYQNCIIPEETLMKVQQEKNKAISEAIRIEKDPLLELKRESNILQRLNNARDIAAKIILERKEIQEILISDDVTFIEFVTVPTLLDRTAGWSDSYKIQQPNTIRKIILNFRERRITAIDIDNVEHNINSYGVKVVKVYYPNKIEQYSFEPDNNAFTDMMISQSKGTKINLVQKVGLLGQQTISGERLKFAITESSRITPHFQMFDNDPLARGFCETPFIKGLTPLEFMMHSIASREGLTDVATKTSDTGYIQRKISNFLENAITFPDGSVRFKVTSLSENGEPIVTSTRIIQFQYGDHGFSPEDMTIVQGKPSFSNIKARILDVRRTKTSNAFLYQINTVADIILGIISIFSLLDNSNQDIVVMINPDLQDNNKTSYSYIKLIRSFQEFDKKIRILPFNWSKDDMWKLTEYEKVVLLQPYLIATNLANEIFKLGPSKIGEDIEIFEPNNRFLLEQQPSFIPPDNSKKVTFPFVSAKGVIIGQPQEKEFLFFNLYHYLLLNESKWSKEARGLLPKAPIPIK